MLSDTDKRILEILAKQQLVTKAELARMLGKDSYDGTHANVSRLMEMGYVDKVESLGTCLVITQKGMRMVNGEG